MARAKKAVAQEDEVKKVSPKTSKKAPMSEETGPDDLVTLKDLCEARDILPRDARIQLRRKFNRDENARWAWAPGSKELAEIEDFLDGYVDRKAARAAGKDDESDQPAAKPKRSAKAKRAKKAVDEEDYDDDDDE